MTIYLVTFDRIGQNHEPPTLTVEAETEAELLSAIHQHAHPILATRFVEPLLHEGADEHGGRGFLSCGFQYGGGFTYAPQELVR